MIYKQVMKVSNIQDPIKLGVSFFMYSNDNKNGGKSICNKE